MLSVTKLSLAFNQSYAALSIDQGLSQATVNTVAQDHQGYIWIGTQDGLNRYDGYKTVQYRHQPGDSKSLSNNFINKIIVDDEGLIWILTANGIDRFSQKTGSFIRYDNNEFLNGLFLWSMRDEGSDYLWILTDNGLVKLNKKTGEFQHIPHGEEFGLTAKNTYDINILENSPNVVATDSGIFLQSKSQDRFSLFRLKNLSDSPLEPKIYCVSNVVSKIYFMCSRNGIYYFYKDSFHYISNQELGLKAQSSQILLTQNNEVLIGTVNGLYFKKLDQSDLGETLKESGQFSFSEHVITSLFEDKDNTVWVGTDVSGVYKIQPTARAFSHFSANSQVSSRLVNNLVTSIVESDSGDVWIGDSRGGISIIDGEDNIRHLAVIDEQGQKLFHSILDIEFDQQKHIWVTNALGLTKFNSAGEQLETVYLDDPSLTQQTYATQLLKSNDGRIWAAGLESGLNLYHSEEKRFIPVRPTNWPQNKPFAKLASVAIAEDNFLWLAGYQGILYRYDLFTRQASQFFVADKNNSNLAITQVYSLAIDDMDRLWIAGMGGIGFFEFDSESFTHLGNQGSITSETHYSVISDSAGFIWSTPANKLIRIDPDSYQVVTFERSMGLPIIEFSPAGIKDSHGRFWLGGLNGVTRFDPLEIIYSQTSEEPILTRIERKANQQVEQNIWLPIDNPTLENLVFSPSVNTFRFSFSVLNFSHNSSIRYRYRLIGYEKSWNSTRSGIPEAVYTQIPYGEYHLQVATSYDGITWSKPGEIVSFSVTPYYWQTYWFKGVIASLIIFLAYLTGKFKLFRIKQRALELEKMVAQRTDEISHLLEQRTRFFSFVSHELKTPLTLVQDPLSRLQKKVSAGDSESRILLSTASRNANRLSTMVERLLKFSTEQEFLSESESILFNKVVKNCTSQLAEFALTSKVSLVLQRNDNCLLNCNPNDIEIIVYNLLSNAIKYNNAGGKVFIRCYSCNGYIVFSVSDQGDGLSVTKAIEQRRSSLVGGGYGLSLANQSVSLLRGKIKVRTRKNVGSMFCAIIPFKKTSLTLSTSECRKPRPIESKTLTTETLVEHDYKLLSSSDLGFKKKHPNGTESNVLEDSKPLNTGSNLSEHKNILMIVEDNRDLREYLCEIFSYDYHCIAAENAELAMTLAVNNIPCLIISDIILPGIDGIQFCQQLKSNQETCHIPILLLTAKDDQESRIYGLKQQATDYLTKPFNSEELKLRVANLLSLVQQRYKNNNQVSLNNLYIDESNTPSGLTEKDKRFMRRFIEILESKYSNSHYNLEQLCLDLYMSKKQLSRKLKAISGKSPMEYLKEYRLEQAVKFLIQGDALIIVAAESGFSSQSYFSTCFKNHFGITPKQFQINATNQARESENNHASL